MAVARECSAALARARVVVVDAGPARGVNRRGGGSVLLPESGWRLIMMHDVAAKIPEAYEWRESAFVGPSVGDDEAGPARGVNR